MISITTNPIAKNRMLDALNAVQLSARRSVAAYLEAAKRARDTAQLNFLEAAAIERAIIADQINAIATQRFGKSEQRQSSSKSQMMGVQNPSASDLSLNRACEKLYRICNDQSIRQFISDLRTRLVGLARVPHAYSASSLSTSISR